MESIAAYRSISITAGTRQYGNSHCGAAGGMYQDSTSLFDGHDFKLSVQDGGLRSDGLRSDGLRSEIKSGRQSRS